MKLKHWFFVLSLVVFFIVLISQLGLDKDNADFFNSQRLKNNTDKPHIIVLGNSLIRAALPFDDEINEQFFLQTGLEVNLNRVTHSGMDSSLFSPLINIVLKHPPDIILIQSEYFYMDFQPLKQKSILYQYRRSLRNLFFSFKNLFKDNKLLFENHGYIAPLKTIKNSSETKQLSLLKKQYDNLKIELRSEEQEPILYELLTQLSKSNTKVILLEMGRSKVANQYINKLNLRNEKNITLALEAISDKVQIDVWRYPANLTLDFYTDFAHLNTPGSKKFTQWLIKKIEHEINKHD